MKLLRITLLILVAAIAAPAVAQDKGISSTNMEILRQKIKADKKLLVAANMDITDAEAKAFWPIYEAYQKDLEKINDRLGKAIGTYADAYNQGKGSIPEAMAKQLLDEALNIEEVELMLKRAYIPKLSVALPPAKVARYIQMELKIRAIERFDLSANLPLVQ